MVHKCLKGLISIVLIILLEDDQKLINNKSV